MIEDFCYSIKDSEETGILLREIRGNGAFRILKDRVYALALVWIWFCIVIAGSVINKLR